MTNLIHLIPPSDEAKRSKFFPTANWRLRQELDKHLGEVLDLAESAKMNREGKHFDRGNLEYCINQLVVKTRVLKKFYSENK